MKFTKWAWTMGIGAFAVVLLSGCGSTPTQPQTPQKNSTYVIGGAPYEGQKNLAAWEQKAKSDPTNVTYLYSAGVSAFQNSQPQLAINYYKKALAIQPNNGEMWNNIGNVYRNSLYNYQEAIQYYKKATTVDPGYDYGWYNWAYTLLKIHNVTAAESVVGAAKKVLPKTDPLYKYIGELVTAVQPKD